MDINKGRERGCLSSVTAFNPDGSKYQKPVCGFSGEDVTNKVCHIYDEVENMQVKFNKITFPNKNTFAEDDLPRIKSEIAKTLGVNVSDVFFNYSCIGGK